MGRSFIILFLIISCTGYSYGQACSQLGQTPQTAFPVCGTSSFNQGSVPICDGRLLPSPCTGTTYPDKNPFWYKFTCFSGGTLGFLITPIEINDDYDWQLFDVTGRDPQEVYTNSSLFVACNWSGESGLTGASAAGTSLVRCDGPGVPLFSSMPTLITGHNYLLMISHFTDSQVGYALSFGGGTADITDPLPPHLVTANANCDGTRMTIKLNKKMKCRSLAANGSDFTLNSTITNVIGAVGNGCSGSFDMDSVTLTLSNPLPPGNYTLTIQNGGDGNTLLDNCDRSIPENESINLTIFPLLPTPMDSIKTPGCSPNTLELVFRKPIRCNSIAPDGTDFTVTGAYPVTVVGASGTCNNDLTSTITIQLSGPMQRAGNFVVRLNRGTDGNTLVDDCSQETPAGSVVPFITKDTVNADFTFNINYGCGENIVDYRHNGLNGANSWLWNFSGSVQSHSQDTSISYINFQDKQTTLIVSNGVCSDTSSATIVFDNFIEANFTASPFVCPDDVVTITNQTVGNITNWRWELGNGSTSILEDPLPQSYAVNSATYNTLIKLFATNNYGCTDTAFQIIKVVNNCYIAVPTAFTPNGDGINDFLYPLNAYKATNLNFSVYNRFGQRIFHTADWTKKWDGRINGQGADPGTYVWILSYIDMETNKHIDQKGTTVLIRQ
jgi:gliding motility-associated-like protein